MLVENFLDKGELKVVFGKPKSGKTETAINLAIAVALGKTFKEHQIPEPAKVLIVNAEDTITSLVNRLKPAWGKPEEILVSNVGTPESIKEIIEDSEIGLVIVDSLDTFANYCQSVDKAEEDLVTLAKELDVAIYITRNVPKEGW